LPTLNNLAANKKLTKKFFEDGLRQYLRFKNDRDDLNIEQKCEVADGMFRCFRSSALKDSEVRKASGQDAAEDPIADTASSRFWRLVNQRAGMLSAVVNATEVPAELKPISNPEVFSSAIEAADQASIHNVLLRYAWKKDELAERTLDYGVQLYKYSNVPVQIVWNQESRRVKLRDPLTSEVEWKEVITNSYPSLKIIPWSMLFADVYGGPIKNQRTVVVLSTVPWSFIQSGVKSEWFDPKQVDLLRAERDKFKWDGQEGTDFKEEQADNEGLSGYSPTETDLYLMWDVYHFSPIENGSWKEDADYTLYWGTAIGNSLDENNQIPVRLVTDFDPDNEIPVYMSNALPDDLDMLYHIMYSETIRPDYALETSAWNGLWDNVKAINDPPLAYNSQTFNDENEDMRYKKGARWDTTDPVSGIREFTIRSIIGEMAQVLGITQDKMAEAMNSTQNELGQSFGGRTPATEGLNINRLSQQPTLAQVRYALGGLVKWWARKCVRYWQGFAPDEMIKMIADAELPHPVYIDKLENNTSEMMPAGMPIYGEFDIEIGVLDEFIEDFVEAQQDIDLLQTVASNPQLVQSSTHRIDFGFWMRDIFKRRRLKNADRIIRPTGNGDGAQLQTTELRIMRETGEFIQPQPDQDHDAHISICKAEELRFKPLLSADIEALGPEDASAQGVADVFITQYVVPHREAHEQLMAQGEASLNPNQQPAQNAPPGTPGQQAGDVIEGILGAAAGGRNGQGATNATQG
jgi:hypothetical protein